MLIQSKLEIPEVEKNSYSAVANSLSAQCNAPSIAIQGGFEAPLGLSFRVALTLTAAKGILLGGYNNLIIQVYELFVNRQASQRVLTNIHL